MSVLLLGWCWWGGCFKAMVESYLIWIYLHLSHLRNFEMTFSVAVSCKNFLILCQLKGKRELSTPMWWNAWLLQEIRKLGLQVAQVFFHGWKDRWRSSGLSPHNGYSLGSSVAIDGTSLSFMHHCYYKHPQLLAYLPAPLPELRTRFQMKELREYLVQPLYRSTVRGLRVTLLLIDSH